MACAGAQTGQRAIAAAEAWIMAEALQLDQLIYLEGKDAAGAEIGLRGYRPPAALVKAGGHITPARAAVASGGPHGGRAASGAATPPLGAQGAGRGLSGDDRRHPRRQRNPQIAG